jgi:hypothetical protein
MAHSRDGQADEDRDARSGAEEKGLGSAHTWVVRVTLQTA